MSAHQEDLSPSNATTAEAPRPDEDGVDTAIDVLDLPEDTLDTAPDAERTDPVIGELPPPSPEDIDLSLEDIIRRSQRADAHLRRWRTTSVDRGAAWQQSEAERMEVQARKKGWFLLGSAAGVAGALLSLFGVLIWQDHRMDTRLLDAKVVPEMPLAPIKAPVVAAPVVAAPVVEASPVVAAAPVAAAPVAAAPVAEAPVIDPPVVEPVAAAAVVEAPAGPAVGSGELTVLGAGRAWTEGAHLWSEVTVDRAGVRLAWFDAAGVEALDRVSCSGKRSGAGYLCRSGRSPKRVAAAFEQGAAAGLWTVKACGADDACVAVATVEVRP